MVLGSVSGPDDPLRELVLVAEEPLPNPQQLAALARRAADTDNLEEVTAEELGLTVPGGHRAHKDRKQSITLEPSDSDDFGGGWAWFRAKLPNLME